MPVATSAHRVRESKDISRILPIKEVVETDNSNRTSMLSTFVAEKVNVLRCYRYPGLCIIHFLSFFVSSNE